MNILNTVKALLKISDDTQDALLTLYIDMATQDALNYTNLNKLPAELDFTIARMVRLQATGALSGTDFAAPVTSVSEAGRSVTFAAASLTEEAIKTERKEIKRQLDRFVQLYAFR